MNSKFLHEIKKAGLKFQSLRDAYRHGQNSIDSETDPDGKEGHAAGIDSLWMHLADHLPKNIDWDDDDIEELIAYIGA